MNREIRLRPIDKVVLSVLALLNVANGVYLASPLYLEDTAAGISPLFATLFQNSTAAHAFGVAILIQGLVLLYCATRKGVQRVGMLSAALLAGFLLRLYSLIGVFLTLESWRPPGYLSHTTTVVCLGAYWVWVSRRERTIR